MKTRIRTATLKAALTARRLELQHDVRARIREGREERTPERGDSIDHSDADVQEELGLALLQMRAETLTRIDEALVRLDAGQYGSCFDCGGEIAAQRLQALPFAVRCRDCADKRERVSRARVAGQRRGDSSLFSDPSGF